MSKSKKVRQAQAQQKAKRNKTIIAASCAVIVVVIALILFVLPGTGSEKDSDGVLNLSTLNQTMLAAEVNRITSQPERYEGRTIQMTGPYYATFNERLGRYQHYVAVTVVDPCCPFQGLEFFMDGGQAPDDGYPTEETRISVAGVFQRHEENGRVYHYIAVDGFEVFG